MSSTARNIIIGGIIVVALVAGGVAAFLYFKGSPLCNYNADPTKKYIGKSAGECSRIRFLCAPGHTYFADQCGCGCREITNP